ncbi:DNA/RNA helicase domain-containing protein [Pedobacter sp. L105]|uniref:DNA/RNA helicase domain-containing protein n=1 Tax=Pedobacter sp. L105 TaxID=1641871 RepID=UPI00352ADA23
MFGKDLKYNPDTAEWEGFPERSFDGQVKGSKDFMKLAKNTYRVLLGRGMKACYVHFMDKDTERYFRSRIRK